MDEDQKLYFKQMSEWIREQEMLEEQLERTVEHHLEVAESNKAQLELHKERVKMGKQEFEEWKKDNNIEGAK